MKKKVCYIILGIALLLTSCASKGTDLSFLQKDGGFVFSDKVDYGDSWEDALDACGVNLSELEEWEYADDGSSPFFETNKIVSIFGHDWEQALFFREDMTFWYGVYQTKTTELDEVKSIANTLYGTLGDGQMPEDEYQGYLDELANSVVQDYWIAENGSSLSLSVNTVSDGYIVMLRCGAEDSTVVSGITPYDTSAIQGTGQ